MSALGVRQVHEPEDCWVSRLLPALLSIQVGLFIRVASNVGTSALLCGVILYFRTTVQRCNMEIDTRRLFARGAVERGEYLIGVALDANLYSPSATCHC